MSPLCHENSAASIVKFGRDLADFHRYNNHMITKTISSEDEMRQLAKDIASRAKAGDVYLLHGPLGAGKSFFARSFIQSLCGNDTEVPSPTFTLVQTYDAKEGTIWHFDLYRLQDPDEIFEIGWEEAIAGGICLVEWPERLGPYVPANARKITIEISSPQAREVTIDAA